MLRLQQLQTSSSSSPSTGSDAAGSRAGPSDTIRSSRTFSSGSVSYDINDVIDNIISDYALDGDSEAAMDRVCQHFPGNIPMFVEAVVNEIVTEETKFHKEIGKLLRFLIVEGVISTEMTLETVTNKVVVDLPDIINLTSSKLVIAHLAGVMIEVFYDENNLDWLIQTRAEILIEHSECIWNDLACTILEQLRDILDEESVRSLVKNTVDRRPLLSLELPWLTSEEGEGVELIEGTDTMDSSEFQTENNSGVQPDSYTDIKTATYMLNKVQAADLKIHRAVLTKPLFEGSSLSTFSPSRYSSLEANRDDVVRKNIYFLARKSSHTDSLLGQLVQFGILSLDDREEINQHSSQLQKAVKMFSKVITKDEGKFPIFMDALRNTDNEKIAQIIEDHLMDTGTEDEAKEVPIEELGAAGGTREIPQRQQFNTPAFKSIPINSRSKEPERVRLATSGSVPRELEKRNISFIQESWKWSCSKCTYINSGGQSCEVCSHSKEFGDNGEDPSTVIIQCPICTLINEPGITECDACGEKLLS